MSNPLSKQFKDPPFPVRVHGEGLPVSCAIKAGAEDWFVPIEVPIAFVYNRRNYAIMMGTPDNLVDFALGFSLTEQVISDARAVKSLDIYISEIGADLRFKISGISIEKLDLTLRRRSLIGSTSCGLCGLENAETLFKVLPRVSNVPLELDAVALSQAMEALSMKQPLNLQTRSVHCAAWVALDGTLKVLREDVGRHNALDKLLGAMAMTDISVEDGFVLMSSRCSYEIVEKAARCGVKAIVSISGPTAFALNKAKEANMSIYSRSGNQAVRIV